MKIATGITRIFNGDLIDGTGSAPVRDAVVVVDSGRITYAGPAIGAPPLANDVHQIDAKGGTIMPGLIEAHFHATYFNVLRPRRPRHQVPAGDRDAAEHVQCAAGAGVRLHLGPRGGCLFNIDVWLEEAIESDIVVGPRFVPGGQEICGAGGLMDWNPEFRKIGMEGVIIVVNGPDEARSAARRLVKDGVEWLKTYPTGDAAAPGTNDHHTLWMTFEEMEAVAQVAHNHRRKVSGHCRATEGIKNALLAGYDSIEHGTFMDNECIDMMLEGNVPCVPALQFELASINNGPEFGLSQAVIDGHQETLEGGAISARKLLEAGGRLGMGGDYGFAWNPHGDYAKELSFFVNYVGFSPMDTIVCATRTGAEIWEPTTRSARSRPASWPTSSSSMVT